jgi:hypothetical protein
LVSAIVSKIPVAAEVGMDNPVEKKEGAPRLLPAKKDTGTSAK